MKKFLRGFLAAFLALVMSVGPLSLETLTGFELGALFEVETYAARFSVHNGVYYPKGIKSGGVKFNKDSTKNVYDNNWEYWSQGASKYRWLNGKDHWMKGGCRIVAYSKLLVESGIALSSFNPDVLLEWAKNKNCIMPISEKKGYAGTGKIPVEYAKSLGNGGLTWKKINFTTKDLKSQAEQVYDCIKDGKYVIVCCGSHYSYVSREYSLAAKTAILSDSSSSWSKSSNLIHRLDTKPYSGYCDYEYMLVFDYNLNASDVNTSTKTNEKDDKSSTLSIGIKSASNVSQNSAKVAASCSYTVTRPSEVSVYIGTSKNNLKKYASDSINHTKNPFDIWYNLKGLKAGTTYYYQFHAKVNGVDRAYGEIKSFRTKPVSSKLTISVKGVSKVTKNTARVDATCTYKGVRPSEVSVYIGTSKSNMKKYASDSINHSKNPFNIWYNLKGLKAGTTYYYQFHAKVNGVDKAYGSVKSFTTTKK